MGSIQSPLQTVASKSGTMTGRSLAAMPSAPVLPMTCPPLIPPPASTVVQAAGKWSRPACALILGVRPNSPIHTIKRRLEQPACAQVVHQRGPGRVEHLAQLFDRLEVLLMRVPAGSHAPLGRGERDLDKRHTALDQPAGQQAALAKGRPPVGVAHRRGLVFQVKRLGRRRVHQPDGAQVRVLVAHGADTGMARQEVLAASSRAGRAWHPPGGCRHLPAS